MGRHPPGTEGEIVGGPFAGFLAVVVSDSEVELRVEIELFVHRITRVVPRALFVPDTPESELTAAQLSVLENAIAVRASYQRMFHWWSLRRRRTAPGAEDETVPAQRFEVFADEVERERDDEERRRRETPDDSSDAQHLQAGSVREGVSLRALLSESERGTAVMPFASNRSLEAAIEADMDAEGPYLAYADWLRARGDPRAELIVVQLALEQGETEALRQAEQELLARYRDYFLSSFVDLSKAFELTWRRGYIESARIEMCAEVPSRLGGASDRDLRLLETLLEHPSACFLRELAFSAKYTGGSHDYSKLIARLLTRRLSTLRAFLITDPHDCGRTHCDLRGLSDALPGLRTLMVVTGQIRPRALDFPELRDLVFWSPRFSRDDIKSICSARLPKLECLDVACSGAHGRTALKVDDFMPIFTGQKLPELRHLRLRIAGLMDKLCYHLSEAPILTRLSILDLSGGTMTDAGASALARNGPRFRHLEKLDVSHNYLTDDGVRRVSGLCANVVTTAQRRTAEHDAE